MNLTINTDGGSRGNPGPAAIGYVIRSDNNIIAEGGARIGTATNNTAEYQAVIFALDWLQKNIPPATTGLDFYLDSKLVVNQISGNFKIKQPHLQGLANIIHAKVKGLSIPANFHHIPREQNARADQLLNQSLDSR